MKYEAVTVPAQHVRRISHRVEARITPQPDRACAREPFGQARLACVTVKDSISAIADSSWTIRLIGLLSVTE